MNPLYFKLAHLIGIMFLFFGMGGYVAMSSSADADKRKMFGMMHGIGLVLLLLGGFGYAGVAHLGAPAWIWVKAVIWLGFGVFPVLARRRILSDGALLTLALIAGGALAWLGLFHATVVQP